MLDKSSPIFEIPIELRKKILSVFINEAKELVGIIEAGFQEKNYVKIKSAAHKLKGSSATVGANELSDFAKQIELSEFADAQMIEGLKASLDTVVEFLG